MDTLFLELIKNQLVRTRHGFPELHEHFWGWQGTHPCD